MKDKVMVIGNVAGGKTRLSRRLSSLWQLPMLHVDTIQFLPGMKIRALPEIREKLQEFTSHSRWLVDGYGPLDLLEKRMAQADVIVFIDLPLWRHQWWLFKRQIKNLWSRREELPEGCHELTWAHTRKMYQTMKSADRQMRPELLRILNRESIKPKVIHIQTPQQWRRVFNAGEL